MVVLCRVVSCCCMLSFAVSALSRWGVVVSPLRRLYVFLFKRLLGAFFSPSDGVDLTALEVSLSKGDVRLHRLAVNPSLLQSTNSLGLPLSVTSATIEQVHAHIPWRALLTEPCTLHIKGLHITLKPTTPLTPTENPPLNSREEEEEEEEGGSSSGGGGGIGSGGSVVGGVGGVGVLGVLSDSLRSVDVEELRRQLRLHQHLTARLLRASRRAEAVDEAERKKAEEERRRDFRGKELHRRRHKPLARGKEEPQTPPSDELTEEDIGALDWNDLPSVGMEGGGADGARGHWVMVVVVVVAVRMFHWQMETWPVPV